MPEEKDGIKSADHPDVEWVDETLPYSRQFGDFFYSKAGGPGETDHVFIEGNDLPSRWTNMDQCTIGELGFGTGLNFLQTIHRWKQAAPADAQLLFVSFEQFPLPRDDVARALSRWPELSDLAAELVDNWHPDFEMLQLTMGGAQLVVFLCDAAERLPRLDLAADAWYLDGFAPSRNPQLWTDELMAAVGEKTVPGGTFATYSVAADVRRRLQSAGFTVEKRPGYAGKREMLRGRK